MLLDRLIDWLISGVNENIILCKYVDRWNICTDIAAAHANSLRRNFRLGLLAVRLNAAETVVRPPDYGKNEERTFLIAKHVVLPVGILRVAFPAKLDYLVAVLAPARNIVHGLLVVHRGAHISIAVPICDDYGVLRRHPTDDRVRIRLQKSKKIK